MQLVKVKRAFHIGPTVLCLKDFCSKKSKPPKIYGSDYGFCQLLALGFDATATTCH